MRSKGKYQKPRDYTKAQIVEGFRIERDRGAAYALRYYMEIKRANVVISRSTLTKKKEGYVMNVIKDNHFDNMNKVEIKREVQRLCYLETPDSTKADIIARQRLVMKSVKIRTLEKANPGKMVFYKDGVIHISDAADVLIEDGGTKIPEPLENDVDKTPNPDKDETENNPILTDNTPHPDTELLDEEERQEITI